MENMARTGAFQRRHVTSSHAGSRSQRMAGGRAQRKWSRRAAVVKAIVGEWDEDEDTEVS